MKANNILVLSLVANVGLGAFAIHWGTTSQQSEKVASVAKMTPPAIPAEDYETPEKFRWRHVHTADLPRYIENLRSIGCPEETIQDIIVGEVNSRYAPRFEELSFASDPFWKSDREHGRRFKERSDRRDDLVREKSRLLVSLLGIDPEYAARQTAYAHTFRSRFPFIAPEKHGKVLAIQTLFAERIQEKLKKFGSHVDPEYQKALKEGYEEELAALREVLSPEELEKYEMKTSMRAAMLRMEFRGFDLTEEEFVALYRRYKENPKIFASTDGAVRALDQTSKLDIRKQAEQLLSPERLTEYQLSQDPDFRETYEFTQRFGLPKEKAQALFGLRKRYAEEQKALPRTGSRDQWTQSMTALATSYQQAVIHEIGPEMMERFKRDSTGWWLRSPGER